MTKGLFHRSAHFLALIVMFMLPFQVAAASSEEEALREYVEDNTLKLVDKLGQIQGLYSEDREAFYEEMDKALGEFIAFRRVAARVMGKYARQASGEQRDQFVEAFRRSLYDAYGGAAVSINSNDFDLAVESVEINPRHDDRATVNLRITTDTGERYGVAYSMYHPEDGDWQMENVIVEGINIGLAFRDQFEQQIQAHDGNVAAVIDQWSAEAADIDGLEDAVKDEEASD